MATVRLGRNEIENGRLPMVCMRCGEDASIKRKKKFAWYPPWVNILIVFGALPALLVASIMTKRMNINAPLCYEHRNHWFGRMATILLSMLIIGALIIGGIAYAASTEGQGPKKTSDAIFGVVCIGSVGLAVAWVVMIAILQGTSIRPQDIKDKSITLKGVSEKFIVALEEERDKRFNDEEDAAPRKKHRSRPVEVDEPELNEDD